MEFFDEIVATGQSISIMMECKRFTFRLPAAVQVSGPSNSGKSYFVTEVLINNEEMIEPTPQVIFYCYSVWQPELFGRLQNACAGKIHFLEGMESLEKVSFDPNVNHVVVLDDLMSTVANSQFGADLFTKISHHGRILIFFITQNIYLKAKHTSTINRNVKYNVVFRNKRFRHELETLARQSLGIKPQHVHRMMELAAEDNPSYPYLIFDLHHETDETKSVVTNVLPKDRYPQAYFYVD